MEPAPGKVRVAINGFGRIGRNAFKVALEDHPDEIEIVAINDLTEPKVLAHLVEYDTAYGRWGKEVSSDERSIIVDGKNYPIYAEKDPTKLPWKDLNVDVVIESTGRFTDEEGMRQHLTAGAKRVVLSTAAKGDGIPTILIGVNHDKYQNQELINNGSCTTNCIAPIAAIIHEKFGILKALMTTVHSVTAEQNLVDAPPPGGKSNDLRRARAAYANIIPTTTGAAVAVTQAIPELKGLFDGQAIRVPTIVGSISDFTFLLSKKTTLEEVKQAIKDACDSPRWKGIVAWSEDPLVSSDIIGRSESSIVDLPLTQLVDGDLLKIFAWYDNEWGYSNRLVEQVINVGRTASSTAAASTAPVQASSAPAVVPAVTAPPDVVAPASIVAPIPTTLASSPVNFNIPVDHPAATSRPTTHIDPSQLDNLPPLTTPAPAAPSHQPTAFFSHAQDTLPNSGSSTPSPVALSAPASPNPTSSDLIGKTSLPLIPASQNPTPPPAQASGVADQSADKVQINDQIVPEGATVPKNNPFLNWFK